MGFSPFLSSGLESATWAHKYRLDEGPFLLLPDQASSNLRSHQIHLTLRLYVGFSLIRDVSIFIQTGPDHQHGWKELHDNGDVRCKASRQSAAASVFRCRNMCPYGPLHCPPLDPISFQQGNFQEQIQLWNRIPVQIALKVGSPRCPTRCSLAEL